MFVGKLISLLARRAIKLFPSTRCYALKALLLRGAGFDVSRTARIVSSVDVVGQFRLIVGDDTFLGHQVLLVGGESTIHIGQHVDIGPRVCIVTGTHAVDMHHEHSAGVGYSLDVRIEDGVWVGAHSTILPGVTIGRKAVIGAGSVVNKDIPPYVMAAGVPCRPIKWWDRSLGRWSAVA